MPAEMPPSLPPEVAKEINKPKMVAEARAVQIENLSEEEVKEMQSTLEGRDYMKLYSFVTEQDWRGVQSESKIDGDKVHTSGFIGGFESPKFEKSLKQFQIFSLEKGDPRIETVRKKSGKLKQQYLETHGNIGQARAMMERTIDITQSRMLVAMNEYRKALISGDKLKAEKLLAIITNDRISIMSLLEAGKGWGVK